MPDLDPAEDPALISRLDELRTAGVRLVIGTLVNAAGLTHAKSVPVDHLDVFGRAGLGAAPVWDVFGVDGGIAVTDSITAVGDRRLRLDLDALRVVDDGRAWGPTDVFEQDGTPASGCPRGVLRGIERRLADADLEARVGHELEFTLVGPDGSALEGEAWIPYGLTGLLDRAAFLDDVVTAGARAGLVLEQLHGEYGAHQFEVSLPPAGPVAAADQVVAAKIIIGLAARRHGVRASFSPAPFPGSVGNGAHQHLSLRRSGTPVFAGGTGPYGITAVGGAAIGGLLAGLTELQGLLTGSVLSGARLVPGGWSGAFAGWGPENREAAVRFVAGGPAHPYGPNVEVKPIDPSASVYVSSAGVLGLCLDGIERSAELPAELAGDPSRMSAEQRAAAGVPVLSADPAAIIDRLERSGLARRLLGDAVVDATVAVRRAEQQRFADQEITEVARRLRLAWSI